MDVNQLPRIVSLEALSDLRAGTRFSPTSNSFHTYTLVKKLSEKCNAGGFPFEIEVLCSRKENLVFNLKKHFPQGTLFYVHD